MKKIKYIILLLPLFLSGCYNYRELNDLGITTAISIDYEDEYKVEAEFVNPIKAEDSSSSSESAFVSFSSSAPSIEEALKKILLDSPQELYGSHLQILVLSKDVIETHLDEVLDFFMRDPQFRSEFKVIIADNDRSMQGIKVQTILDNLSSSNILKSLELEERQLGITKAYTLNDIASMYLNPNIEITMPSITLTGNLSTGEEKENTTLTKPDARVKISKTAVFKDSNLLGYLTDEESKTLSIIKGDIKNTILNIPIEDSYVIFEPNRLHTKTDIDIKNNTINVEIKGYARVSEVSSDIDIENKKEVEDLTNILNNYIEDMVHVNFISIRDKYNSDIFGIRDLYYKKEPSSIKDISWYDEIFPNINIKVESKIKLYEKGNTKGGIRYERENS